MAVSVILLASVSEFPLIEIKLITNLSRLTTSSDKNKLYQHVQEFYFSYTIAISIISREISPIIHLVLHLMWGNTGGKCSLSCYQETTKMQRLSRVIKIQCTALPQNCELETPSENVKDTSL